MLNGQDDFYKSPAAFPALQEPQISWQASVF